MQEDFTIAGNPMILNGTVTSVQNAGGQVGVRLEHHTENNYEETIRVMVVGEAPKKGDRGLIIFKDSHDSGFKNGYWLGSVHNRFADNSERITDSRTFESKLPEGTRGFIDDTGNNQLLISGEDTVLKSKNNEFKISPLGINSSTQNYIFSINSEGFNINLMRKGEVTSKISLNNTLTDIYSVSPMLIRSGADINFKSGGNVSFKGNSVEETGLDLFHVKAGKVVLDSGSGATTITGSAFNVKIGSSAANLLGSTAASIEVLQGDMDFSVGLGDITIRALSPANKVKITNGFTIAGIQSYMEVGGFNATMGAELVPGLGATFTATRSGNIEVSALKTATFKSNLGMTLSSMTTMELDAIISMKMETIKMDIIATAMIKMESALLDIKAVTMLDTGPKVATPGPGPLCSMPVCPITGAVLTGSIAVG